MLPQSRTRRSTRFLLIPAFPPCPPSGPCLRLPATHSSPLYVLDDAQHEKTLLQPKKCVLPSRCLKTKTRHVGVRVEKGSRARGRARVHSRVDNVVGVTEAPVQCTRRAQRSSFLSFYSFLSTTFNTPLCPNEGPTPCAGLISCRVRPERLLLCGGLGGLACVWFRVPVWCGHLRASVRCCAPLCPLLRHTDSLPCNVCLEQRPVTPTYPSYLQKTTP